LLLLMFPKGTPPETAVAWRTPQKRVRLRRWAGPPAVQSRLRLIDRPRPVPLAVIEFMAWVGA